MPWFLLAEQCLNNNNNCGRCRLSGIEHVQLIKCENGNADTNESISNNILLDVVNSKRTNVVVSAYAITLYEGQPAHIYCGENYIFMKSNGINHCMKLSGVKQLQSDSNVTWVYWTCSLPLWAESQKPKLYHCFVLNFQFRFDLERCTVWAVPIHRHGHTHRLSREHFRFHNNYNEWWGYRNSGINSRFGYSKIVEGLRLSK